MEGNGDWQGEARPSKVLLYLALALASVLLFPSRPWQMVDTLKQESSVPQLSAVSQHSSPRLIQN